MSAFSDVPDIPQTRGKSFDLNDTGDEVVASAFELNSELLEETTATTGNFLNNTGFEEAETKINDSSLIKSEEIQEKNVDFNSNAVSDLSVLPIPASSKLPIINGNGEASAMSVGNKNPIKDSDSQLSNESDEKEEILSPASVQNRMNVVKVLNSAVSEELITEEKLNQPSSEYPVSFLNTASPISKVTSNIKVDQHTIKTPVTIHVTTWNLHAKVCKMFVK